MRYQKIKLIGCLIIFICFICITGCSSREMEYGDFTYIKVEQSGTPAYIEITGLTDAGREKDVLIIPDEINGIKVNSIVKPAFPYDKDVDFSSENLKKLYLPTNLYTKNLALDGCSLLESIFILKVQEDELLAGGIFNSVSTNNIYIFSNVYFKQGGEQKWSDIFPANVTYYYNFGRADNYGCFWLDNIEQGEKITHLPPTNPVRERYEFGGWYKEPECINKWDFENDVMPTTDGDTFYELKLYAKWN